MVFICSFFSISLSHFWFSALNIYVFDKKVVDKINNATIDEEHQRKKRKVFCCCWSACALERDAYDANNEQIPFSNLNIRKISQALISLVYFIHSALYVCVQCRVHKLWINNVSNNIGCDIYHNGIAACMSVECRTNETNSKWWRKQHQETETEPVETAPENWLWKKYSNNEENPNHVSYEKRVRAWHIQTESHLQLDK